MFSKYGFTKQWISTSSTEQLWMDLLAAACLPVHFIRLSGDNIGVINQNIREQCLQKIYLHVEEEYK